MQKDTTREEQARRNREAIGSRDQRRAKEAPTGWLRELLAAHPSLIVQEGGAGVARAPSGVF